MNGAATRRGVGFGPAGRLPPNAAPIGPGPGPNGKALVEGYRKDIMVGFEKEKVRYDAINNDRPQSSPLVDLKDPVQIHLLTETALSDSKGYEILSQEEVDDLKKQIQSLTMRVEQARTNLAIQSKYRDAAISMAKLYSPAKPEGSKRLSLRGNRMSDSAKEAEMEKQASERRCEELATELFNLEKRLIEPQRRLLEHTAGILQMTHRASSKKSGQPLGPPMPNGIPGSPESLYTYTNPRNSLETSNAEADFGDRNLYLPLDQMEGQPIARQRKNTIEIPMKSPIREQNSQLRGEMDRIKEENVQLKMAQQRLGDEVQTLRTKTDALQAQNENFRTENDALQAQNESFRAQNEALRSQNETFESQSGAVQSQSAGQARMISEIEAKLESLNSKLRNLIISLGPARSIDFDQPDRATGSGGSLMGQLQYLERGLGAAAEERESLAAGMAKDSEMAAAAAAKSEVALAQTEGRIDGFIDQLQDLAQQANVSLPPGPVSASLNDQLDYVEKSIRVIGDEIMRTVDAAANGTSNRQGDNQVDAVLSGLWDIILNGLFDAQQQKATRRKARAEKGLESDEEDMSDSEPVDPNEPYSLSAFSTKVQWLFAQATSLKEQKAVLKRQIKQQRDLNNKSGSEKDEVIRAKEKELEAKEDELDRLQELLDNTEREAMEKQEQLAKAIGDMERMQKSNAANDSRALKEQLDQRSAALAALEASYEEVESNYREVQTQLSEAEKATNALKQELADKEKAVAEKEKEVADKEKEVKDKDEELERMNVMVIELKTELTFAKAELDGAYGSRRERAAEAAALTQTTELENLNKQVINLKAELASTLRDFEDITRESIAAEKEKIELEAKLDDAMAAKESLEADANAARSRLEAEVGRLQEQLDAERLKVPPSPLPGGAGAGPRAGATMLSEQFRATMKEERKKFQEELREEQAKRRKLEDEMRALRRGVGPGRSPLGPLSPR
ncbi:Up-regulated during septation-domain-containing protein [Immersiella caudata]|uniref:Up-regulated during septation-domain-containing protein n=1 Tax=Immersiella caudata TaxID=314043 RepID=A0AA40C6J1_9PEZI|nr:Up-regulated during septation-domain-containing protein [Immersiella caudata]